MAMSKLTPAKRVYIGNAVFMASAAWFAFRPLYVGFDLIKSKASGEMFIGALIWLCVILMLALSECAVYYSFRFCKMKKRRFALWGAAPFCIVTLLRILYAILQS